MMKKQFYVSPLAACLPLETEQSLCDASVVDYLIISGELDPGSD